MKIVLLSILVDGMIDCEEVGISSIAAFLRKNGHEVLLLSINEGKIDYAEIESFRPNIIGFQVYDISNDYYKYTFVMSSLTQLRAKFVGTCNEKGVKVV